MTAERGARTAVVTGGTRGVGLAVARRLCADHDEVLLVYGHSDDDAEQAVKELAQLPGSAHAVRADLTQEGAVRTVLDEARERWGGLDLFVHCAADWHPGRPSALAPKGSGPMWPWRSSRCWRRRPC